MILHFEHKIFFLNWKINNKNQMSINDGSGINSIKKNPVWIVLDSSSENQPNQSNQFESNEKKISTKIDKDAIVQSSTLIKQVTKKRRRINRKLLQKKTKEKKFLKALKESVNMKRFLKENLTSNLHNQKIILCKSQQQLYATQQNQIQKGENNQDLQQKELALRSKLKKKFTIKNCYNLSNQFTSHQSDPFVEMTDDYPFFQDEYKTETSFNIFTNRLKSIVSINKLQNSQQKKVICSIFYQQQFEKIQGQIQDNHNEITPQIVELDKVRLLYPQKLLQFYILADDYYRNKTQIKKQELNLSEKTQQRIKYLLK